MTASISSDVAAAAKRLIAGGLVAIPTETVYGLAADAESESAVAKIYHAKNRPNDHPVIVHVSNAKKTEYWAREIPDYAKTLMAAFWPGPMTLILKRRPVAKDFITGGQDTVGLRVPAHPAALEVLTEFEALGGKGVAAPSANRFGAVSPTSAQAVSRSIGKYLDAADLILEGGSSEVGVESTIIDCTGSQPAILRPGGITLEQIERVTGMKVDEPTRPETRVSGSHKLHYSPEARVLIDTDPSVGDGLIALANIPTPPGAIRLLEAESLEDYARGLYAAFSRADELGLAKICVFEPQGAGLAIAIRDRVRRAAAKG